MFTYQKSLLAYVSVRYEDNFVCHTSGLNIIYRCTVLKQMLVKQTLVPETALGLAELGTATI